LGHIGVEDPDPWCYRLGDHTENVPLKDSHLPIHPSLACCKVTEATSGDRGGELYFREAVKEGLGPLRKGSAETHPEKCYFGGAIAGRVQVSQDVERFRVVIIFSEIIPC
jgi:hypothetical protein